MAGRVKQFQFYFDGNDEQRNKLTDFSYNIFENYAPIKKIGIQTMPNIKFYFNRNKMAPLYIDNTGVFELDLEKSLSLIGAIHINSDSYAVLERNNSYLIITILYEGEGDI